MTEISVCLKERFRTAKLLISGGNNVSLFTCPSIKRTGNIEERIVAYSAPVEFSPKYRKWTYSFSMPKNRKLPPPFPVKRGQVHAALGWTDVAGPPTHRKMLKGTRSLR